MEQSPEPSLPRAAARPSNKLPPYDVATHQGSLPFMGSPPWLVDGFLPSAFREGGVEDGESVGGYWRGRKNLIVFGHCLQRLARADVEQVIDPQSSAELSYAGTTAPTAFSIAVQARIAHQA
ncbi:hypothetical protein U1Q18_041287 [Sarracenia purpurea var. burkii]